MASEKTRLQGAFSQSALLQKGKGMVFGVPNRFLALFLRRKWLFLSGFFVILLLLSLGIVVKEVFVVMVLTIIASFSTYYKRYVKFTFGFELVTFSTVLSTIAYGAVVGALVGFVSAVAAEVIPQVIDASSFFWIISVSISAFAVAFFHSLGVPLFWLGFISIAVQFLISEPIRLFSGDQYLQSMSFVNIITTSLWTILWFRVLAPLVLPLL